MTALAMFSTVGHGLRRTFSLRTTNDRSQPALSKQAKGLMAFIQSHFLDVVGDRRLHKPAERFSGGSCIANRRGGNRLIDLIKQMDGDALEHKISRGCLLVERAR